ncbi:MAG: fluoride efflux transporter FluC, partial [Gammaproteobacteria bacterium]
GTLAVNVLGSFLMGLLFVLFSERIQIPVEARALVLVGFLGAFTTFSTFSMESLQLIEQGEAIKAGLNMLISVATCMVAVWLGVILGRSI